MLVKSSVHTNIVSSHLLFSKLLDLLDGSGCSVLEPDAVEPLVEVDGVLAGHDLAHGRALTLLLAFRRHLEDKLK